MRRVLTPRATASSSLRAGNRDPPDMLGRMHAVQQVVNAATARASALTNADAAGLSALLHPDFRWTSHVGETYNRQEYIRRNTQGHTVWCSQELVSTDVVVVGDTAVLCGEVTDVVPSKHGEPETFRMPMTQVWVRIGNDWQCLAGHAGPLLT
jgi:ketosteroid isomerase-like protein